MKRTAAVLIVLAIWWLLLFSVVCPVLASDCSTGICGPQQRPAQRPIQKGNADISLWPQTCRVSVRLNDGTNGIGSGVWCHAPGYSPAVLTAAHVLRGASGPIVCYFPATGESLTGELHAQDTELDVACIVLRGKPNLPPIWIAAKSPEIGDHITLAGMGGSPRKGFIAVAARATQWLMARGRDTVANLISVAVPSSQGDSGGPALNTSGQVVGIISASDRTMTVIATGPRGGNLQALRDLLPPEPQEAPQTVPIPEVVPEQTEPPETAPVVDPPEQTPVVVDPPPEASTPPADSIPGPSEEQSEEIPATAPAKEGVSGGDVADVVGSVTGVSSWMALAAALGISGPLGIGIGVAGWLISRRMKQRQVVSEPAPVPQQPQEVGNTDSPFLGQRDISEAKQMLRMANDIEGRNAVLDALAGRVAMDWLSEQLDSGTAPEARKGFARDLKDYIYRVIDQMAPLAIKRAA